MSAGACATAPPARPEAPLASAEADRIAEVEDARTLGDGFIEAQVRAASPAIRERALLALARLQRRATRATMETGLKDADPSVRAMAAFAIGQLGLSWDGPWPELEASAERRLLEALEGEAAPAVRLAILGALGKVGGDPTLLRLAGLVASGPPAEREAAATAAGIVAYRAQAKKWNAALDAPLAAAAKDADARVRYGAVYAAMRAGKAGVEPRPALRAILRAALADTDAEVRSVAARGLAEVAQAPDFERIGALVRDPVVRVAAEAARALGRAAGRCDTGPCAAEASLAAAMSGVDAPPVTVLVAAFNEPMRGDAVRSLARAQVHAAVKRLRGRPPVTGGDAALGAGYAALAAARAGDGVADGGGFDALSPRKRKQLRARALAEAKTAAPQRIALAMELARDGDAAVRTAAIEALVAEGSEHAKAAVVKLIDDPDLVVAATAAEGAAKLKLDGACEPVASLLARLPPAAVEATQSALGAAGDLKAACARPEIDRHLQAANVSVRFAAAKAIEALTGARPEIPEVAEAPGPSARADLPPRPRFAIETLKGPIAIELFAEDAPHTARNFAHLARRKFFDGLTFHRVVPNFVIQGGDPRGDGSGGPGYSIRCEINRRPYEPGTVGMALSGKDTGGSQFFITTSRQPHLDGRYTVFGRVVEGLAVVESILEGDAITSVSEVP